MSTDLYFLAQPISPAAEIAHVFGCVVSAIADLDDSSVEWECWSAEGSGGVRVGEAQCPSASIDSWISRVPVHKAVRFAAAGRIAAKLPCERQDNEVDVSVGIYVSRQPLSEKQVASCSQVGRVSVYLSELREVPREQSTGATSANAFDKFLESVLNRMAGTGAFLSLRLFPDNGAELPFNSIRTFFCNHQAIIDDFSVIRRFWEDGFPNNIPATPPLKKLEGRQHEFALSRARAESRRADLWRRLFDLQDWFDCISEQDVKEALGATLLRVRSVSNGVVVEHNVRAGLQFIDTLYTDALVLAKCRLEGRGNVGVDWLGSTNEQDEIFLASIGTGDGIFLDCAVDYVSPSGLSELSREESERFARSHLAGWKLCAEHCFGSISADGSPNARTPGRGVITDDVLMDYDETAFTTGFTEALRQFYQKMRDSL